MDERVWLIELTLRYDDRDAGMVRRWRQTVQVRAATLAEALVKVRERAAIGTSLPVQSPHQPSDAREG